MKILFKTIDELKEYITVDISSNFKTIAPYIRQAQKYTTDIIGKQLHSQLLTVVHGNNDEEKLKELLDIVRLPLANFSYLLALAQLNVNVGDTGFTVTVADNLEPASKWRIDEFRTSVELAGNDGLEDLIEFLEDNINAYPTWKTSNAYSYNKQFFLNNATEINDSVFIEISRMKFLDLKKAIYIIEQSVIKPAICNSLFQKIKAQITADSIPNENKLILNSYIRPATIYLALNLAEKNENYRLEGQRHIEQLVDFLNVNADSYLDYKNSNCYTEPATYDRDVNTEENSFFVSG